MESMSNCPYLLPKAREGMRLGHGELRRLDDPRRPLGRLRRLPHGLHGRDRRREVRRHAPGAGRVRRSRATSKAIAAIKAGKFKDEILPVPIPQKKGEPVLFADDESPREDTSLEALGKLKPAFKEDGTVTAGNAPGVNDGAAALVVTSAETAQALWARSRWPASWPRPSRASSRRS